MNKCLRITTFIVIFFCLLSCDNTRNITYFKSGIIVSEGTMDEVYKEVKTPYKYGVVFKHPDTTKMIDSPTVYREGSHWYMTYIVFDGQGYETWLAKSKDLLNWKTQGRIMTFTRDTWDANQKAGYMSLVDITWEGSYKVEKYKNKYWMSYLGGSKEGYETGKLGVGLAHSSSVTEAREWARISQPVLLPDDQDSRWFEKGTIFKSIIIRDKEELTGYPFVMYYNARGDTAKYESIGMAVSDDMINWKRLGSNPLITRHKGICGDAQIARINNIYVMFYFGAFWKPDAFERFACSYDLVTWTDWDGEDLIAPSTEYDKVYAHKPWVMKYNGIVYHFYNAVGNEGRVIALATSKDLKQTDDY